MFVDSSGARGREASPLRLTTGLDLHLFGLDYRTLDPQALGAITSAESEAPRLLRLLAERPILDQVVLLMTCHRCEVYVSTLDAAEAEQEITQILAARGGDVPWRHLTGLEVAVHLCRVACGLDSSMVGEPQVLGQTRRAWREAAAAGSVGSELDRLFRVALSAGRRARQSAGSMDGGASLADAAITLVEQEVHLGGRRVVVIGSGEMAALLVAGLRDRGAIVIIAARSVDRAAALGVPAIPLEEVGKALADADVVFSATSAQDMILDVSIVTESLGARDRPLVLVDLALPADIDTDVRSLPGVTLFSAEDVAAFARKAFRPAQALVERFEQIAAEAAASFERWARTRAVVPSIVLLREHAETIRRAELSRTFRRLPDLTERERTVVAALTRTIVNRLLHTPVEQLKQEQANGQGDHLVTALDILFAFRNKRGNPPGADT